MSFDPKTFQIPPKQQIVVQILQDVNNTYSSETSLMPSNNIRVIYANNISEIDKQHIQRQIEKQKLNGKIKTLQLEIKNDNTQYNSSINFANDIMISNKQQISEDLTSQIEQKHQQSSLQEKQSSIKQDDDKYFSSILGDDENEEIKNLSFSSQTVPQQIVIESIQETNTQNEVQSQKQSQQITKTNVTPILLQNGQQIMKKEINEDSKVESEKQSAYTSQMSKTNSIYQKNKKTVAQLQREEQEKIQANMIKLQLIEQIQSCQKDLERTIQSYDKIIRKIVEDIQKQKIATEQREEMLKQKNLDYLAVIIGLSSMGLIRQLFKVIKMIQNNN